MSVRTHAILQALLLAGLLSVVNLLAARYWTRVDVTSQRAHRLSNEAEDLLARLPYEVDIWLTSPEFAMETPDKALPLAWQRTLKLLQEFAERTKRVRVNLVGAADQAEQERMQPHWHTITPNMIYLLATLEPGRTNKKSLDLYELYEGDPATGKLLGYRGEPVLLASLRELGGTTKRIVYQTEGHQEWLTDDPRALGFVGQTLGTNEGLEFRKFPSVSAKAVPEDCDLLMIVAPGQPFTEHEAGLFRDHLERGGGLLVAVRPLVRTGLESFFKEYGIRVGEGVVIDPREFYPPRRTDLLVRQFSVHAINRSLVSMANVSLKIPQCAVVEPLENHDPSWNIVPLARSGPEAWEEKTELGPEQRPKPDPDERVGNLPLVVAVSKPASHPREGGRAEARMIVWGSPLPFTNSVLMAGGMVQELQFLYVTNNFRWLMAREMMQIEAERIELKPLQMSEGQLSRLRWVVRLGFPAFAVALGLLAWWVRRK